MHKLVFILLFGFMAVSPLLPAHALKSPRPQGVDSRIHTIMYGEHEVFKFTGHYGYQSSIIFESGEKILTISMGDSIPWQITPSGNRIFLKPIDQDAQTNMTVLTNKRRYLFELHAEEALDINDPALIWEMQFIYPTSGIIRRRVEKVPEPELEGLDKFNFNYAIRGSSEIAPLKIYDDGEFTYFKFRDKNAEIPSFYQVAPNGEEAIINFRSRDDLIIVERVTSRFTLRIGQEIVCVYNEARPFRQSPLQQINDLTTGAKPANALRQQPASSQTPAQGYPPATGPR